MRSIQSSIHSLHPSHITHLVSEEHLELARLLNNICYWSAALSFSLLPRRTVSSCKFSTIPAYTISSKVAATFAYESKSSASVIGRLRRALSARESALCTSDTAQVRVCVLNVSLFNAEASKQQKFV